MDVLSNLSIFSSLVSATILLITYYHLKVFTFWKARGVKGPTPWPILGTNIYYIFENKHEVERKWRIKYGPVVGLYNNYVPRLLVSDADVIKHVMVKRFRSFMDRGPSNNYDGKMDKWIFFEKGDYWKRLRVSLASLFSSSKLKAYMKTQTECASDLKSKLENKKHITKDELLSVAMDIVCRTMFGLKIDTYQGRKSEFYQKAYAFTDFDFWWSVMWFILPKFICEYFKIPQVRDYKFSYLNRLGKAALEGRKANKSIRNDDLVQALIELKLPDKNEHVFDEEDDIDAHYIGNLDHKNLEDIRAEQLSSNDKLKSLEDHEMVNQMTFFFIAGLDTTSSSLSFIIYMLAHNQEAQREVYEELSSKLEAGVDLEYSNLASLEKLDAFVSETLRLLPPVTELQRSVVDDTAELPTDPPLTLSKGSIIIVDPFIVHRDPELWKDPDTFDMCRFMGSNKSTIKQGSYMPFGIGPRSCAATRFALISLKTVIVKLLREYSIHTTDNPNLNPKFTRHPFFLQLQDVEFRLESRKIVKN